MIVMDPGHRYALDLLDSRDPDLHQELIFVKREGPGYPKNKGHHPGTNLQEVLRACIDRMKYLNSQIPDERNPIVIYHLRRAIRLLEERAADRHDRILLLDDMMHIEDRPTCSKCRHIGCVGECHS